MKTRTELVNLIIKKVGESKDNLLVFACMEYDDLESIYNTLYNVA